MAEASLVGRDIEAGGQLLRALDEAKLPVPVAFWYRTPEIDEWRLYLGTPLADKEGPRAVYAQIQHIFQMQPSIIFTDIPLDRISVGASSQLPTFVLDALSFGQPYVYRLTRALEPVAIPSEEAFGNPRIWSEEHGQGWHVAAQIEGVRREGIVTYLTPVVVTFRDHSGVTWKATRDRVEWLRPPGPIT